MTTFQARIETVQACIDHTNSTIDTLKTMYTRAHITDFPHLDAAIKDMETLNKTRKVLIDQLTVEQKAQQEMFELYHD